MTNTGRKIYTELVEVTSYTGQLTGRTKPNVPSDPDYIPPQQNTSSCPIQTATTTTQLE